RTRLLPLREAVGARAVPPARPRGSARPDGRSLPAHLRGLARAAPSAARGLPAAGPEPARPAALLAALLVAGQAAHGRRPAPPARARSRREPGRVRAAPPRARGAGAGGAAA